MKPFFFKKKNPILKDKIEIKKSVKKINKKRPMSIRVNFSN